jgi:hypothetical protein
LNEFGETTKIFQLGLLGSQMAIKGLPGGDKEYVGADVKLRALKTL